jgi:uncharacterized protein YhdP
METVFSMRPASRLHKESICLCELVRQLEVTWELAAEVGGWQTEVSPARVQSTNWSQRSEFEVSVRWSPNCKDVSPETEDRPRLEAATKQRNLGH